MRDITIQVRKGEGPAALMTLKSLQRMLNELARRAGRTAPVKDRDFFTTLLARTDQGRTPMTETALMDLVQVVIREQLVPRPPDGEGSDGPDPAT
jgi:hypothetical protein